MAVSDSFPSPPDGETADFRLSFPQFAELLPSHDFQPISCTAENDSTFLAEEGDQDSKKGQEYGEVADKREDGIGYQKEPPKASQFRKGKYQETREGETRDRPTASQPCFERFPSGSIRTEWAKRQRRMTKLKQASPSL